MTSYSRHAGAPRIKVPETQNVTKCMCTQTVGKGPCTQAPRHLLRRSIFCKRSTAESELNSGQQLRDRDATETLMYTLYAVVFLHEWCRRRRHHARSSIKDVLNKSATRFNLHTID